MKPACHPEKTGQKRKMKEKTQQIVEKLNELLAAYWRTVGKNADRKPEHPERAEGLGRLNQN